MRAVVTRVKNARVEIDGKISGAIDQGFLVLLASISPVERALKRNFDKDGNRR